MRILWQMITGGTLLILAVLLVRRLVFHRVPKRFFVLMWCIVLLRLLVPFSVPVAWNPDALEWAAVLQDRVGQCIPEEITGYISPGGNEVQQPEFFKNQPDWRNRSDSKDQLTPEYQPASENRLSPEGHPVPENHPVWIIRLVQAAGSAQTAGMASLFFTVWIFIAVMMAAYIVCNHIKWVRRYRASLPMEGETAARWMAAHSGCFRRNVQIRISDEIRSPLTYGVFCPVILLPAAMCHEPDRDLICILEHEWNHIRHFDTGTKYAAGLALCLYWFHPLVWVMYVLLERDMELASDEEVLADPRRVSRSDYAMLLIRMAERQKGDAFSIGFSQYSRMKERIQSIMKIKKYTVWASALVFAVILCMAAAFILPVKKQPGALPETGAPAGGTESLAEVPADSGQETPVKTAEVPGGPAPTKSGDSAPAGSDFVISESSQPDGPDSLISESGLPGEPSSVILDNVLPGEPSSVISDNVLPGEPSSVILESNLPGKPASAVSENNSDDGTLVPTAVTGTEIVELAVKYIGNPYEYGGTDLETGVDSSGFVQAVYQKAGIALPRTIDDLSEQAAAVDDSEIAAGDLIFYGKTEEDKSVSLSHVAIYIGDQKVIHASNKKEGIKISALDYRDRVSAGRVIN